MVGWHTSRPLINFGQSVGFGQPSAKTRAKPKSRSRLHVVPVHPAPRPVRSRSPRSDRALPALRRDAPSRVSRGPARLPVWRDEDHRREALVRLDADIYSASNSGPHAAKLNTIELALSEWCFTHGYVLPQDFARRVMDLGRSAVRGLGGPVRARPLPLDRLHLLPGDREPWVTGGPLNPRGALASGTWFLLREQELASTRACLVEFFGSPPDRVRWHLPASKTDYEALGVGRTHSCRCSPSTSPYACPVHLLLDHLWYLQEKLPGRWSGAHPDEDLPLFPDQDGSPVSKVAMAQTILYAADLLVIPRQSPDGSERFSGHSLRVGGAQGLALLGWHLWTVQAFGRWGSDVVKAYLRDVVLLPPSQLCTSSSGSASSRSEVDLESILSALRDKLALPSLSVPASSPSIGPELAEELQEEADLADANPEVRLDELLLNLARKSGYVHRRLSSSRTVCGWVYVNGKFISFPSLEESPRTWTSYCERCFSACFPEAADSVRDGIVPWHCSP